MNRTTTGYALAFGLCLFLPGPQAHAQHAGEHIMLDPSELIWNDLPSLPGVKISVIEGPLNQAVPIMFRLKFPPQLQSPSALAPGGRTHHHHFRHPAHGTGQRVRRIEDPCVEAGQHLNHAAWDAPLRVDR